jgi:hypothetical protein
MAMPIVKEELIKATMLVEEALAATNVEQWEVSSLVFFALFGIK